MLLRPTEMEQVRAQSKSIYVANPVLSQAFVELRAMLCQPLEWALPDPHLLLPRTLPDVMSTAVTLLVQNYCHS